MPLISEKTVDYRSVQTLLNHPKITAAESNDPFSQLNPKVTGAVTIELYGMSFRYTH